MIQRGALHRFNGGPHSCASHLSHKEHLMTDPHLPQDGDVLVSNPTATVEHDICIVPHPPHLTCESLDRALAAGRELAEELKVDAWLSEDHRHVLRIGTYRE
jgi:hypothetical protein